MKRILSMLLTLCMLSSFMVCAAEDTRQTVILDNDNANNTSGTVNITGAEVADNVSDGIVADTEFGEFGSHYKVGRAMANREISLSYEPELAAGKYSVYINRPAVRQQHARMTVQVIDTTGTHEPEYSIVTGAMNTDEEGYIFVGAYDFSGVPGQDKVVVTKPAGTMGPLQYARWDSVKFEPYDGSQPIEPTPTPAASPTPDLSLASEIILDPTCAFAGMHDEQTEGRVVNAGASAFTVNEGTGYNGQTTAYRGYNGNPSSMTYYPKLKAKDYEVYMRVNVVGGSWGITNIKICNNNTPVYEYRFNWGAYNTANVVTDEDGNEWLSLGRYSFSGTGDADYVQLSMVSGDWGYAYYNAIRFSPVQGMAVMDRKVNGSSMTEEVSCYADSFEILFSNRIEAITSSSATVTDSAGNVLSSSCSKNATRLTIELLDSLKSGEEYTLQLSGITDCFGGRLNTVSYLFKANDSDVGSALIDVNTPQIVDGKLVVSGKVYNSMGNGISGRTASLRLTNPSGTVVENSLAVLSGKDGIYSIEYAMPENADSGTYSVRITTPMCQRAAIDTVVYTNSGDETRILNELKNTASWEAAKQVITENSSLFGLTTSTFPDDEKLYDEFVGADLDGLSDLVNAYNKAVVIERINQATDVAAVKAVLEVADDCSKLGIVTDSKTVLPAQFNSFAEEVLRLERYDSYDEFKTAVGELFNSAMMREYNIVDEKLKEESVTAKVGEGVRFSLSFPANRDNVKAVTVELLTDDDLFEDFYIENTGSANASCTGDKKERSISIVFDSAVSAEKLADIMFTAAKDMIGSNTVKARGSVTYEIEGVPYQITAEILESTFDISVKAAQSNNGGGGGSGGSSVPSGPAYSSPGVSGNKTADTIPDSTPDTTLPFDDLDSAEWAREAILALYEKGIVSGVGERRFEPNSLLTREQFAAMLIAAFAEETFAAEKIFSDADENAWYAQAVTTAYKNGWIQGYEDGSFGVGKAITREDMAAITARVVFGEQTAENTEVYSDDNEISGYAHNAVYLMTGKGIMSGVGEGRFAPKATATRAMAVKIIYELLKGGY